MSQRLRFNERCEDGRLMIHKPQHDDPYFEIAAGICPECDGKGCSNFHECGVCGETVENGCEMDGCRDPDCPMQGDE